MSLTRCFDSMIPERVNNHLFALLMLSVLALTWGSSVYAGVCDPVVVGEHGLKVPYSAVYSSCTATESAVENTVAIKYNPSGYIDSVIATQSAFIPTAPASTASIGTITGDEYYAQDMGIRYVGNCTDMNGSLQATPAALLEHFYCFRFIGASGDLYLGGLFGASNTFSSGKATVLLKSDFVTTWKTDNPGISPDTTIVLPMMGGPYDLDLENDGVFDYVGLSGPTTCIFSSAGTHTIRVRGTYDSIRFADGGDREKILSIDQWGTNAWTTMYRAFSSAVNLTVPATDTPDFSAVTSMASMFRYATSANPDTSGWDTSAVSDMRYMFEYATSANPDTSGWDTSAVTYMSYMFSHSSSANPDTSAWDTAEVIEMSYMFSHASSANPDTSGWNTSSVKTMLGMFWAATTANPDTSGWDTSSANDMRYMFQDATSANPDTSGWDTSAVRNMQSMFAGAIVANPDIRGWNTSLVFNMSEMFYGATSANPDISGWDTSAVRFMNLTFKDATSFDRDIGSWNITALEEADEMLQGVTLSTQNYDSLLVGWNSQALQSGVNFDGGNSTYCSAAAIAARANMIASDTWTITDGGPYCPPQVTCNVNIVAGETEIFDATLEACEILSLGPDYIAADGSNVTANSGWEIDFQPGFTVEAGATLNANVCGQSLCETSTSPMPLGCHSCVDLICASDAFCCILAFDQTCLAKVDTDCHLVCRE